MTGYTNKPSRTAVGFTVKLGRRSGFLNSASPFKALVAGGVASILLGISAVAQLPAANPVRGGFDPARLRVAHETVKRFVENGKHAGIIILLARNGKIADAQAYGYRDIERELPMERDTICRIYSMSKIITSVAVLTLLEDGRFNLDDAVGEYLPELKEMKVMTGGSLESPQLEKQKRPITIKDLLTHTSGLTYDFDGEDPVGLAYKRASLWSGPNLQDFVRKVGTLPLKHQPGEQYTYGINTDVLGALVEKLSGRKFGTYLEDRIFGPLGMKDTGFDVPESKGNRLAKTYRHKTGGGYEEAEPIIETWPETGRGIESGGGGLFSTVDDYARFAQMLCDGGTFHGKRILGRKTVELMTANHLLSLPESAKAGSRSKGFGLGVEMTTQLGRVSVPSSVGQFGWYGAATTYCQIDPEERLVAIAFAQHFPYNEHNLFAAFATAYYQALK